MNKNQLIVALICVAMLALGQVLFKKSGMEIRDSATWFTLKNFIILGLAFLVYILATFLWISLLKALPLSRAYVFMSLSFVLVPIASVFVFDEKISFSYMLGVAFIVLGIFIASRADL